MRRTKLGDGLDIDSPELPPRRRGPRTALSDAQLRNRRDQLVQIFESAWGDIGWELQRCKKADDLIRIFGPVVVPGSWFRDAMIVFCRASSEQGSGATLRKLRVELRALAEPLRSADESERRTQEQLHQVNWALDQASKSNRRMVKRARKKRRKEAWKAKQQYRTLSSRERQLEARVRDLESSFARQELFRFLKSKRYELTPLNLANAAAGLPGTGWRQSVRRCIKAPSKVANGQMYQIFKAIRYLATTANKKIENALVTSFRDGIPLLPSRYRVPKGELAEKWFYLERAIRHAYRTEPRPKALPFEITKRYFRQIQSQSQVDMVLAEQAKLRPSKQSRASRSHSR